MRFSFGALAILFVWLIVAFLFWPLASRGEGRIHGAPKGFAPRLEAPPPSGAVLRFAVLGNTGASLDGQREVAQGLGQRAMGHEPSFIMLLGDLFQGRGVESVYDAQWSRRFGEVYGGPMAHLPFYAVLGDRDLESSAEAIQAYSSHDPRWVFPAHYYTFARQIEPGVSVQFFILDTTTLILDAELARLQRQWLIEELEASKARWKVVMGHDPLFGEDPKASAVLERSVVPVLKGNEVDLYLCAGPEEFSLRSIDGLLMGTSGTGSEAGDFRWRNDMLYAASRTGFMWIELGASRGTVEVCAEDGSRLHIEPLTTE